jgi:hypothetical protein
MTVATKPACSINHFLSLKPDRYLYTTNTTAYISDGGHIVTRAKSSNLAQCDHVVLTLVLYCTGIQMFTDGNKQAKIFWVMT